MEPNLEDQTAAPAEAEAAPVRRRASRRVSAAAGAAPEVAAAPEAAAGAVTQAPEAPAAPAAEATAAAPAEEPAAKAAPKRASRARKKVEPAADAEAAAASDAPAVSDTAAAPAAAAETAAADAAAPAEAAPKKRATRARKTAAPAADAAAADAAAPAEAAQAAADAPKTDAPATDSADTADAAPAQTGDAAAPAEAQPARRSRRRASQNTEQAEGDAQAVATEEPKTRGRGGNQAAKADADKQSDKGQNDKAQNDKQADKGQADKQGEKAQADKGQADKQGEKAQADKQQQNDRGDAGKQEGSTRSSRTRQRDRKRRGGDDLELEIAEDDVLLPVAGILDVLDNYAFVRTSGYLPGVSDVYVALGQVKKYNLRRGDAIVGAIRQPREGDSGGRQKYNAIVKIDSVNGKPAEEAEKRPEVGELTAIFPAQPLKFAAAGKLGAQIDEHAPMALGQRALVALPATIPATPVLAQLAQAVTASAPEAHLLLVLTNARPEEVTHLERTVNGEVIAATFDRAAEDQTTVVELGIDRASRLVELGHDVVVLLDSLTDVAQAHLQTHQGARTSAEAAQALAIAQAKRLLGAARNLENGGSLTLLATAHTHTGVTADKDLLRALTPAANSFVKITGSRQAPEVNADKSYTISF